MASRHTPHFFRAGLGTFIILGVVFLGALTITGGLLPSKRKPVTTVPSDVVVLRDQGGSSLEQGLQLKTLEQITPTPVPVPTPMPVPISTPIPIAYCPSDNGIPIDNTCQCNLYKVECQNHRCVRIINPFTGRDEDCSWGPGGSFDSRCPAGPMSTPDCWCSIPRLTGRDGTGLYCVAKPVIYLYPTKKTLVDVSVETTGKIVVSDPLYPLGGWKNVTVYPDGKLIYQNKEYRELFYETSVTDIKKPDDGLIIKARDIEKTLKELNNKLGLTEFESKELTDFWIPRLKNLSSNYVLISLVDQEEKNKIDRLNIKPTPDTLIEILYYFKPLNETINIKPLNLPPTPKRIGFTAVEWGGTIEY